MTFIVKTTTSLLLGCILICCINSNVIAQDAVTVFNRCSNQIDQINRNATEAQREAVDACVTVIDRLLEMGEIQEARLAAQRCRARLDLLTERGTRALRETCQPCLETLRELKALRLTRRLSDRCEENAQQLAQQNERAQNAINELF